MNNRVLANRSDLHIMRKLWHIFCGTAAISLYYAMDYELLFWGKAAFITSLLGFSVDFIRMNSKKLNDFILKILGPIMRTSEKESFSGLPFYALGIALSIFLYDTDIALLSILYLVYADPMSSFIGVKFGKDSKDKILPNKSLQGALACFTTCYLITFFYLSDFMQMNIFDKNLIGFTLLSALIGTISELCSAFNIDDNVTIPLISGAGITALNHFFQVL